MTPTIVTDFWFVAKFVRKMFAKEISLLCDGLQPSLKLNFLVMEILIRCKKIMLLLRYDFFFFKEGIIFFVCHNIWTFIIYFEIWFMFLWPFNFAVNLLFLILCKSAHDKQNSCYNMQIFLLSFSPNRYYKNHHSMNIINYYNK